MEQTCIHSFMPPDCGPGKNTKNCYIFLSKNMLGNILIAYISLLFSIGHDTEAPPEKTTTEYYGKIVYIFVRKTAKFYNFILKVFNHARIGLQSFIL